jgi:hypothetical protein
VSFPGVFHFAHTVAAARSLLDYPVAILPTDRYLPAPELLNEQVSNRINGRHSMDADEILLIATIGALLPYLAVAVKDWIARKKSH